MPKAIVSLKIYTDDCDLGKTVEAKVQSQVWDNVLKEYLREFLYNAECASLGFRCDSLFDNVDMEWSGFNDSMIPFVEETIQKIK